MTRTDVMASSRPRTPGAVNKRSRATRALVTLPIVLLVGFALLLPGTALAEEPTSGYNQTPTTPTTPTTPATTPTTPTPTTGTSPSKETEEPTTTTPKETEPTKSAAPAKEEAKTLPFTGFDLRWSFGIGLALMAAGFSIVVVQRRRREGGR
jgi:outer membrane biosynthesis protein TonB